MNPLLNPKTRSVDHMETNENWPDSVRLKMIERSNFYQNPHTYQYGYYDGYQLQREKINKPIELIQKARSNGEDAFLQNAIITLIS